MHIFGLQCSVFNLENSIFQVVGVERNSLLRFLLGISNIRWPVHKAFTVTCTLKLYQSQVIREVKGQTISSPINLLFFFTGNVCHLFFAFLRQVLTDRRNNTNETIITTIEANYNRAFPEGVRLIQVLPKKEDIKNHKIDELYEFSND